MAYLRWFSFFVIFLWAAGSTEASVITASSCSASDINTAISVAVNGDTVAVPSGTCTWSNSVTIPNTKGITLQGAGIGSTVITGSTCGSQLGYLVIQLANTNAVVRVTGFSFNLTNGGCGSDTVSVYVRGATTTAKFRIDHNRLYNCKARCIQTWGTATGDLKGLIDHNTIECSFPGSTCHAIDFNGGLGSDGQGWESFARPISWGSDNAVFVEDNTFTFVDMQDNVFDAYAGSRFVFRNNTVYNTMPGVHGADSGGRRGVHSFELYRNTFTVTTGPNLFTAFNYRSGSILQWGNTWSSKYNEQGRIQIYRVDNPDSYPPWGMCDGTHVFDGNGTIKGYPCLDQTGWFNAGATSTSAGVYTLAPAYFWSNVQNGSPMVVPVTNTSYVANNREMYTSTGASCTSGGGCTTGVGIGTALPTSCTKGVAFWKTDEGNWDSIHAGTDGVLYKCTGTNTWNVHYTPYTYPHPLQTGQIVSGGTMPPPAPANLTVQ